MGMWWDGDVMGWGCGGMGMGWDGDAGSSCSQASRHICTKQLYRAGQAPCKLHVFAFGSRAGSSLGLTVPATAGQAHVSFIPGLGPTAAFPTGNFKCQNTDMEHHKPIQPPAPCSWCLSNNGIGSGTALTVPVTHTPACSFSLPNDLPPTIHKIKRPHVSQSLIFHKKLI